MSHKTVFLYIHHISTWYIVLQIFVDFLEDLFHIERDNPYYFFRANQQKADTKIYLLTQCSLTVNECDWHILAGNQERIKSHCLTRDKAKMDQSVKKLVYRVCNPGIEYTYILHLIFFLSTILSKNWRVNPWWSIYWMAGTTVKLSFTSNHDRVTLILNGKWFGRGWSIFVTRGCWVVYT